MSESKYIYNDYQELRNKPFENLDWMKFNTQKMGEGSQSRVDIYDTPIVIKETPIVELPDLNVLSRVRELRDKRFRCLIPTKVRKIGDTMLLSYPKAVSDKSEIDAVSLCISLKKLHKNNIAYWDLFEDNVIDGLLIDNGLMSWADKKPHKLRLSVINIENGIQADLFCLSKNFTDIYKERERTDLCSRLLVSLYLCLSLVPISIIILGFIFLSENNSVPMIIIGFIILALLLCVRVSFGNKFLFKRVVSNYVFDDIFYTLCTPIHHLICHFKTDVYFKSQKITCILDLYEVLTIE